MFFRLYVAYKQNIINPYMQEEVGKPMYHNLENSKNKADIFKKNSLPLDLRKSHWLNFEIFSIFEGVEK